MNQEPKNNGEKKKFQLKFPPIFKKKPKTEATANVKRFDALANEGLTTAQVEERKAQGLVNKMGKKYSKTYRSIFIGNLCTFFNFLCLLAALALLLARAPLSQFMFVLIFLCNICFINKFCNLSSNFPYF